MAQVQVLLRSGRQHFSSGRLFCRRQVRRDMSTDELGRIMQDLQQLQRHMTYGNTTEASQLRKKIQKVCWSHRHTHCLSF